MIQTKRENFHVHPAISSILEKAKHNTPWPGQSEVILTKIEPPAPFDVTGQIIAYEMGDLDEEETINLFQELVNNGMAWTLQGHYGRTAAGMLQAGIITNK